MCEANYLNILTALRRAHDNPNIRIGVYARGPKDVEKLFKTIQEIIADDEQIGKSIKMMRKPYYMTGDITFMNGSYVRIASVAENERAGRYHEVLYAGALNEEAKFFLKSKEILKYKNEEIKFFLRSKEILKYKQGDI